MTRAFIYLTKFLDKWDNLGMSDDNLLQLERHLLENPNAGNVVRGTGGLRKLRWKLPETGKSGGIRIAYIDVVVSEKLYMLDLFPKTEKDNYSSTERNILKQLINDLKNEGA